MAEYWTEPKWAHLGREFLLSQGPDGALLELYVYSSPLAFTFTAPRLPPGVPSFPAAVVAQMVSMAAEERVRVLGERAGEMAALLPTEVAGLRAQLAEERQARIALLAFMDSNPTDVLADYHRLQRENEQLREELKGFHGSEPAPSEPVTGSEFP